MKKTVSGPHPNCVHATGKKFEKSLGGVADTKKAGLESASKTRLDCEAAERSPVYRE
jgi:hypothetical protein